MVGYTKIDNVFKRFEDGTKKLDEGNFRSETIEILRNHMWYGTEKIDGTNIGIVWDGHRVSYQGRTERANIPAHLMNRLVELFGGNDEEELFEQLFGDKRVIFFGEGFGAKIQSGGNYIPDGCDFILFDVYLPDDNIWLTRESVVDIANKFGIRVVPVVFRGTINEAVEYIKTKPKSTIGKADMEGIVCKPIGEMLDRLGKRIIVKVKVRDFE